MSQALKNFSPSWRADNRDIGFYEAHARDYAASTFEIDLGSIRDKFLARVRAGGLILDVGSGSGRDTLAFLQRGFRVEAIEPSQALAELSYKLTTVKPRSIRVQDLAEVARYDGIWACASLVHVSPNELADALSRLVRSAVPSAPIYLSFKYGHGVRIAGDGRPYTDLTETELADLLEGFRRMRVAEQWLSQGPETTSGRDLWINVILVCA
jgi:SAM-dependent methyltransferase